MKKLALVTAILLLLLISLFLRLPGFYLRHFRGDQIMYMSLAMKLDNFGFREYNLQGIDVFRTEDLNFVKIVPAPEGSKGNFLGEFPSYYDIPLYHKPPLFIYALMISHRLFASDRPYLALSGDSPSKNRFTGPKLFLTNQFYAVFVPLLFSLLLIMSTFYFGKILFSNNVGICAAALLSISPIELLTSQKIFADDMLSFFVTVAFILYYVGRERGNLVLTFLAGLGAGLAALTKPSGNVAILVILVYEFVEGGIFSKKFMVFLITSILVALPWHWQVLKTYGQLFYIPASIQARLLGPDSWFKCVVNRPWYMYLVNVPFQTPLLFLVYPALFLIFKKPSGEKERMDRKKKIFLLIWIAIFLISFLIAKVGRELRYILPAYPAIAILSAEILEVIRKKLDKNLGYYIGSFLVIAMILLCAWWSVSIGWRYLLVEKAGGILLPL